MRTPVTFVIFNRPDLTATVFTQIARARPPKLLVIADGPRECHAGDADKCAAARAVIERVDWPCEVLKNYSDQNMGCGRRLATGLQWVFQQVDEAIILEDDCLPQPAFFPYCDELLERYRDDERVMHISGDQFLVDVKPMPHSYSFSRYPLSWGWATWRRAFQHYDLEIPAWPALRQTSWLADILGDERAVAYWTDIFDATFANVDKVNTWDFQWVFACWAQSGLSILPSVNLISNVGFREDATHTKGVNDPRANLPGKGDDLFPLQHPTHMIRNRDRDRQIFSEVVVPGSRGGLAARLREKGVGALPPSLRRSLSRLKSRFAVATS